MKMDLKRFVGSRVRSARNKAELTQEQLAERVDRYPETISNIERGRVYPGLKLLEEIASVFDTQVSYFFEGFEKSKGSDPGLVEKESRLAGYASRLSDGQLSLAFDLLDKLEKHDATPRKRKKVSLLKK